VTAISYLEKTFDDIKLTVVEPEKDLGEKWLSI
jgi:hypothetical protein